MLGVLPQETYNQFFTMHGTVMMFLFAVPIMEAIGVMLLPQMLAARDLPFPRLSAYAFWAYFVGGLCFFCSIFFGLAPNGGWFMYPPLTSTTYSPGINADFWLLGIGFIEISAIAGAIEILVGILKTRAPGMTLARMPLFAWAMLVFAGMILIAFPAVILATLLLELERALNWPFFDATRGGDPMLWQHLFWFFGHPEVYIIFLPAAGLVSMMVATPREDRTGRLPVDRPRLAGDRLHQLRRVGAPHVRDRHADAVGRLLLRREHGGQHPRRHPGVQLDRDARDRQATLQHADPVRHRRTGHLRHGRADRGDGGDGAVRLAGARHPFHRRASSLRADRRRGVPGIRGFLLLVRDDQPPPLVGAARASGYSG